MKMKFLFSLLILFFIYANVSVWGQHGFKSTPIFKGSTTIAGQKLKYLKTDKPEITSLLIEMEAGGEIGRHRHLVSGYVYVMEGAITVEMEDGSRQVFQAGQSFLEATNTWHNAKNMGKVPIKLLVVTSGEEGRANLIRSEEK